MQERLRIEAEALELEAKYCPAHVPKVFLYDACMAVVAMQYIASPAIILRRGLIQVGGISKLVTLAAIWVCLCLCSRYNQSN